MGLQNQLNDVASDSIPLLLLALFATALSNLRSFLLAVLQSLRLSRLNPNSSVAVADDPFLGAVGSGLASLIVLSDQLSLNRRLSYTYSAASAAADGHCVVCQNSFSDGDQVRRLPCRHLFHRRCFDGWLDHLKFNCPLCRSPLVSDDRLAVADRRVGAELVSWFSVR